MRLPLCTASAGPGKPNDIYITDAGGKVLCIVLEGDGAGYLADQIIERFNVPWWQRLWRPRDEKQRAYDKWVWETNKGA